MSNYHHEIGEEIAVSNTQTWCCTDSEGAMRGVRITVTREEVAK